VPPRRWPVYLAFALSSLIAAVTAIVWFAGAPSAILGCAILPRGPEQTGRSYAGTLKQRSCWRACEDGHAYECIIDDDLRRGWFHDVALRLGA
jgi:hypothetical protein